MKKNVLRNLLVTVFILTVVVSFTGCNKIDTMDRIEKNNQVIMGTNAEFPPFEYINDEGEVDGFDAELARQIADELGVELVIENMEFGALINALQSGKIDFIAAGMTVTEDRKQNVDFSNPYYNATQLIIKQKGNEDIHSIEDLEGKKIGVQEGTTGDFEAEEIEGADVSRYRKAIDGVMDLKNGRIDAVIIDSNPAKVFVGKNDDLELLEEELTEEDYAIATRKEDAEFLDAINKVIEEIKTSGKYEEMVKTYIEEEE
jgi:polar amino acid transport system substrate-binding protein